jgi:hypothetical protein
MKQGLTPTKAVLEALNRIIAYHPDFSGALIAVNVTGHYGNVEDKLLLLSHSQGRLHIRFIGAACHGFSTFQYTVFNPELKNSTVITAKV